jgi:hypothetical protein
MTGVWITNSTPQYSCTTLALGRFLNTSLLHLKQIMRSIIRSGFALCVLPLLALLGWQTALASRLLPFLILSSDLPQTRHSDSSGARLMMRMEESVIAPESSLSRLGRCLSCATKPYNCGLEATGPTLGSKAMCCPACAWAASDLSQASKASSSGVSTAAFIQPLIKGTGGPHGSD